MPTATAAAAATAARRRRVLGAPTANFGKRLLARSGFIASVYATLAIQLAVTAAVVTFLRRRPDVYGRVRSLFWLWFVLSLLVILALAFVPLPIAAKVVLFAAFAILLAFNFVGADRSIAPETIRSALISAAAVFVTMTVLGFGLAAAGVDLSFMVYVLLAALIGLIVTFVVLLFVPVSKAFLKGVLLFGMTLFAIFIAYDTNVLLQPNYLGDFVDAAIGLYLDVVNLVSQIIGFDTS